MSTSLNRPGIAEQLMENRLGIEHALEPESHTAEPAWRHNLTQPPSLVLKSSLQRTGLSWRSPLFVNEYDIFGRGNPQASECVFRFHGLSRCMQRISRFFLWGNLQFHSPSSELHCPKMGLELGTPQRSRILVPRL